MGIYEQLGIKRVINGNATLTRLGGSLMPREVLSAMMEAANAFVDMEELQTRVGEEIAEMTGNEAAFVCAGASAGIALTAAACIAGQDPEKRARLPWTDGMRNEVIFQRVERTGYDFAIHQAGGKRVEIGDERGATLQDLVNAVNGNTAAIFLFPKGDGLPGAIPISEVIAFARQSGIPVIVDASAQLPPPANLWRFTQELGADAAIFSGGKGLCGPQSSGLILGRKEFVEACRFHAFPKQFLGRPMKVGKEEMVGLYAAVRWYLNLNHDALMDSYERMVGFFIEELRRAKHVTVARDFPSEARQPMPRALITLDEEALDMKRDEVLTQLLEGNPAVDLAPVGRDGIYINPQTIRPGEERIILTRLLRIFLGQELVNLRREAELETA